MNTQLSLGSIDCGCVMTRRQAALEVGFTSRRHEADWDYIQHILENHGVDKFRKVNKALFIHN